MNINDIKTVAMIGAGDMGHGIAEVALLAGYKVNLYDIKKHFKTILIIQFLKP